MHRKVLSLYKGGLRKRPQVLRVCGCHWCQKDSEQKGSACTERRKDWQGRGPGPEPGNWHPGVLQVGTSSAPRLNWSRLQWDSKGAPGTGAGEEGQGGFTISLACEWLGLLHLISSRRGLAHSHANPFSVGRLGPTTQCRKIAWGQKKTKDGCVSKQGCQAQGMSQSGRRDSDQPCFDYYHQQLAGMCELLCSLPQLQPYPTKPRTYILKPLRRNSSGVLEIWIQGPWVLATALLL